VNNPFIVKIPKERNNAIMSKKLTVNVCFLILFGSEVIDTHFNLGCLKTPDALPPPTYGNVGSLLAVLLIAPLFGVNLKRFI